MIGILTWIAFMLGFYFCFRAIVELATNKNVAVCISSAIVLIIQVLLMLAVLVDFAHIASSVARF